MIFSRSLFILFCFFFLTTTNSATAGYGPETRSIKDGGGTWGSILGMSADVRGSSILFTIRKQDGLSFNTESNISIRTGSYNGPSVAANIVPLGSSMVSLQVRPDSRSPEQSYYAYLFNSYGYAWVGPLKIDKYVDRYSEVPSRLNSYSSSGTRLERPRIDNHPRVAFVKEEVRIAVTAGYCRDSERMRLQCYAEDYNQQQSNRYNSLIQPYGTVQVPFIFNTIGPKTLFCKIEDRCGDNAWASRSLNVKEHERMRTSSNERMQNSSNETKINISVVTGADGTTDSKVSVQSSKSESCAPFCKGSGEITYDKPYLPEAEYQEYAPAYPSEPREGDYVRPESVPDL
jgi:hypothetical protein